MIKQVPTALAALAVVIGLVIGYPLASAFQPTKTVTKTVTKTSVSKIENGQTTQKLIAGLGNPQEQLPAGTAKIDLSGCYALVGKMNAQSQPQWVTYVCINPTQ